MKTTIEITIKRGTESKTYELKELEASKGGKLKFAVLASADFPESEGRYNVLYVNAARLTDKASKSNIKARK